MLAFDYSQNMVQLARKRQAQYQQKIELCVADATSTESLLGLKRERKFTKAVSNMAIMDITDIRVLFKCVNTLLDEKGIFVFATQHPCFVTLTDRYLTAHSYYGLAIDGQPREQCYYHRSLQDLFHTCLQSGFVIDGFYEEAYGTKETPDVIITRVRKQASK